MKQYRATQLETFRRYMMMEYVTFDDMIRSLKGETVTNDAMRFGTAAHKACEMVVKHKDKRLLSAVGVDDYLFSGQHILAAVDGVSDSAATEITYTRDFIIHGDDVQLKGTCDVVQGNEVMDYKNTFKSITDEKLRSYEDSLQWQAYLVLTGCQKFTYNVMQWKNDDGIWYITNQEYVTCSRYTGIIDYVEQWLRVLHEFAIEHGVADE